jgi:uncharacterized protein (DUF983 family)
VEGTRSRTLDPAVATFLERYPPVVWIMKARCPRCRSWAWVDLIAHEAQCARGHTVSLQELNAYRAAHPARPTLPAELRAYYPQGVTCPACGARLALRIRQAVGRCAACAAEWTFAALIDAAAARIMAQAPNGAVPDCRRRGW